MSIQQENKITADVSEAVNQMHQYLEERYPGYMTSCVNLKATPVDVSKAYREIEDNLLKAIRWHAWISQ